MALKGWTLPISIRTVCTRILNTQWTSNQKPPTKEISYLNHNPENRNNMFYSLTELSHEHNFLSLISGNTSACKRNASRVTIGEIT